MKYQIRYKDHTDTRDTRTQMFNRADMSYFGFSYTDVTPPEGFVLTFDENGEPLFVHKSDLRI